MFLFEFGSGMMLASLHMYGMNLLSRENSSRCFKGLILSGLVDFDLSHDPLDLKCGEFF